MWRFETLLGVAARRRSARLLVGLVAVAGLTVGGGAAALADTPPRHAELDGNGPRDDLVSFTKLTHPNPDGTVGVTGWDVNVRLETGRVLSAHIGDVNTPSLKKVGNVDGRPGDELFVTSTATGAGLLDIFTYHRGSLVHEKPQFSYGGNDIVEWDGVVCTSRRGRHFITQRTWLLDEKFVNHQPVDHWSRRDTVYVWTKGHLRKFSTSKWKRVPGQPARSKTGIACAHDATS